MKNKQKLKAEQQYIRDVFDAASRIICDPSHENIKILHELFLKSGDPVLTAITAALTKLSESYLQEEERKNSK